MLTSPKIEEATEQKIPDGKLSMSHCHDFIHSGWQGVANNKEFN